MTLLFYLLGVTVGVIDENFSQFAKINTKRKFRKTIKIKAFRNFVVEISGIEPLTS